MSIRILPDNNIFYNLLEYLSNYNINNFILKSISYNPLDEKNLYNLDLFIDYGKYEIEYKNEVININYNILKEKPLGLSNNVKCYEEIILNCKKLDTLKNFIISSNNINLKKDNKYLVIYIYKNFWSKINKLPKRELKTIYLNKVIKDDIYNDILNFFESENIYNEYGIPYKRTYLFEGIPGSGKTSFIFSLASEFNLNISIFNFSPDIDDTIFIRALNTINENTLLLIEDIDCIFTNRENNKSNISFSGILNTLDGVSRRHKLITFITTNYKNKIDEAFIRPGRIDYILNFDYACKEQIKMMFNNFRINDTNFDIFYEKIKTKKYSTATLQKFFFNFKNEDNIVNYIKDLDNINNLHLNNKKYLDLYN